MIAAALVLAIAGVAVGAPLAFGTGPGTGGVTDSVVATSTVPVSTTGLALPSEGILFSRMKDGHQHIYVMAADGSDPQPVTDSELGDTHPSASPDGGRIVFVREDKGLMLLDAGGEKQLTEDAAYQSSSPTWSSDGERVFYSRLDSASEGASRYIHSMKADGTDDRKVSPAFSGSVGSDDDPALSSDGETLVFVTTRRPGPAVPGWAHGQGLRFDLFNGGVPDDFVLTVDGDTIAGSATYPYEGGTMNNELMLRRTK